MKIARIIYSALLPFTLLNLVLNGNTVLAQEGNLKQTTLKRTVPPTRDPHTAGYVTATELPDGVNPSPDLYGNFIIGPTHNPAQEMIAQDHVPQGTVYKFSMDSKDSKIYPGIARIGASVRSMSFS